MQELERRIIDISYKKGLSHIGSCLSSVGTVDRAYEAMNPNDRFVLSNGHAFLALATVLEKRKGLDAEKLVDEHGTHPNRNPEEGIYVSTGSLGQGIPIGVGMALADRTRDVYIVSSDGECAEGSVWEALRVASEQRLENLKIAVVANGFSAYGTVDADWLDQRLNMFYPTLVVKTNMFKYPEWLNGLAGHYTILDKDKYEELLKTL